MRFCTVTLISALFLGLQPLPAEARGQGRLPDPTRPAHAGAPAYSPGGTVRASGPVLRSTMVSPYRKVAVINGRSFRVGDRVNGAEIIEIRSYEVVLKRGGRVSYLRLLPELTKQIKN